MSIAGLPAPTGPPARVVRSRWHVALLSISGVVAIGWGIIVLLRARRRRRRALTLEVLWLWVERDGSRVGVQVRPGFTVQEYARRLDDGLLHRAEGAGRWPGQWDKWARESGILIKHLAELRSMVLYSGYRIPPLGERELHQLWRALRKSLRRFRWLRRVQGFW